MIFKTDDQSERKMVKIKRLLTHVHHTLFGLGCSYVPACKRQVIFNASCILYKSYLLQGNFAGNDWQVIQWFTKD